MYALLQNPLVIVALAAVIIIELILIIVLFTKVNYLTKIRRSIVHGLKKNSLEELLENYLNNVHTVETQIGEANSRLAKLEDYAQKSLQNTAVIRYSAFEKMGSDLSFSAAFLDLNQDGLVISSINSREESRVYAKPIAGGKSTYPLTQEELKAMELALEKGRIK